MWIENGVTLGLGVTGIGVEYFFWQYLKGLQVTEQVIPGFLVGGQVGQGSVLQT
jgi:hypothetical protein